MRHEIVLFSFFFFYIFPFLITPFSFSFVYIPFTMFHSPCPIFHTRVFIYHTYIYWRICLWHFFWKKQFNVVSASWFSCLPSGGVCCMSFATPMSVCPRGIGVLSHC